MNYRKATLGLSLLVAGLGMVVWNMRPEKGDNTKTTVKSDYRLMDFQMNSFDENGKVNFSLQAPLLERNTDGKSLTINQPQFTFPNEAEQLWHARADSAWVSDRAKEVQLRKNVTVTGPKSPLGVQTQFFSEQLLIFPKQNRIHSDEWVTINHGTTILKGLGLEADMNQRRVQLLAKVHAHYAPPLR